MNSKNFTNARDPVYEFIDELHREPGKFTVPLLRNRINELPTHSKRRKLAEALLHYHCYTLRVRKPLTWLQAKILNALFSFLENWSARNGLSLEIDYLNRLLDSWYDAEADDVASSHISTCTDSD